MTDPADRLAGLVARREPVGSAAPAGDRAEGAAAGHEGRPEPPDDDLLAGARLRTEVALAAVARAAAVPGGRVPGRGGSVRWRIGPQAALAAAGVLVLVGGAAAWWWWPSGEPARVVSLDGSVRAAPGEPSGAASGASRASAGSADGTPDGGTEVVVHVVGAVASPGVVRLAAGSRVTDAVDAAGGALVEADLSAVNLARVLTDGEQVVVPTVGAAGSAGGMAGASGAGGGGTGGAGGDLVDLNAADATALDALPGIGPVLAQRIVSWRAAHGRFTTVDELGEVTGIGPTLLAGLRDLVRV